MAASNGGRGGRRSSLKHPQVQEELRNLVPQDLFKGSFSEYSVLSNMTRLSGNSLRGSVPQHRSMASGIPRSVTRKPVGPPSRGRATQGASVSRSIGRAAPGIKPNVMGGRQNALMSNLNITRVRSMSQETLRTPGFTPSFSRSRSKSPGAMSTNRRRGGQMETNEALGRAITLPNPKDKKSFGEMAKEIFEILQVLDCPSRPADWQNLASTAKLPVSQYFNMIKFLAVEFVPESFFAKGEDPEKVMELSKILRYPGTISKSHLKTPTAQHAWPSCFGFLAWLSCRTMKLHDPPQQSSNIEQLASGGLEECAFESYLNLFPLHFRNELAPEHIEIELENFKARVRETHAVEATKTKEELIQERDDLQATFDRLQNESDPAKDLKSRLQAEQEVHATLNEKIRDVENHCKKYSSTRHLALQQERIELEINTKKSELERLKKQVEQQPLSKQEASAMKAEISGLKSQLDTIRHVNANLKAECESRLQKFTSCQNEFYESCKTFGIVERYNENLRFLRLDDYTIPPNPFAPKELEDWMKEVTKTLRKCQTRVNEMVKQVTYSSEQKEKENQEFLNKMNELGQEIEHFNSKIKSVQKFKDFLLKEHEEKRAELQSVLDEINSKLQDEDERLNKRKQGTEAAAKTLSDLENSLKDYQNKDAEINRRLEEGIGEYKLFSESVKKTLIDIIKEEVAAQRAFYIETYGVDLWEGYEFPDERNSSNNNNNGNKKN